MPADRRSKLSPFERVARDLGQRVNEGPWVKRAQLRLLHACSARWVYLGIGRRVFSHGLAELRALRPEKGVVLAANHRSFFDLWATMLPLFYPLAPPAWLRTVSFPVRSEFFYDHPLGLFLNMLLGFGCMYPPIYRETSRSAYNDDTLARIVSFLGRPGSVVGIHPEGRRNRDADPYHLLPAQPGVGQIVLRAKPVVIPVFINGLTNSFVSDVRTTLDARARRTAPIVVVYGKPVDYHSYLQKKPRLTLYKRLADQIHAAIAACGATERTLRQAIEGGEADPPGEWLAS